jgi:hypothetical protein
MKWRISRNVSTRSWHPSQEPENQNTLPRRLAELGDNPPSKTRRPDVNVALPAFPLIRRPSDRLPRTAAQVRHDAGGRSCGSVSRASPTSFTSARPARCSSSFAPSSKHSVPVRRWLTSLSFSRQRHGFVSSSTFAPGLFRNLAIETRIIDHQQTIIIVHPGIIPVIDRAEDSLVSRSSQPQIARCVGIAPQPRRETTAANLQMPSYFIRKPGLTKG